MYSQSNLITKMLPKMCITTLHDLLSIKFKMKWSTPKILKRITKSYPTLLNLLYNVGGLMISYTIWSQHRIVDSFGIVIFSSIRIIINFTTLCAFKPMQIYICKSVFPLPSYIYRFVASILIVYRSFYFQQTSMLTIIFQFSLK